jgi:hypothetical protein
MTMWQRRQHLRCPTRLACVVLMTILLLLPLESFPSSGYLVQAFTPSTTATNVAFGTPASVASSPYWTREAAAMSSSTALAEKVALRTWNLNREAGSSPFGLDLNAEVWNGRVAQVRHETTRQREFWRKGKVGRFSTGTRLCVLRLFVYRTVSLTSSFDPYD